MSIRSGLYVSPMFTENIVRILVYKSINRIPSCRVLHNGGRLLRGLEPLNSTMKAGQFIHGFCAKDKRRVTLRALRWEDLEDLLCLINSLVDEGVNIVRNERVTRNEEIDWLSKALSRQELDEVNYVVAEVGGQVVANSEIRRNMAGCDRHVGNIGIAIKDGFRDIGLGTEMMKTLVERGRGMAIKVLTLSVFASNERAIHVYTKLGFKETGRIPRKFFKEGRYIDELIMTQILE